MINSTFFSGSGGILFKQPPFEKDLRPCRYGGVHFVLLAFSPNVFQTRKAVPVVGFC